MNIPALPAQIDLSLLPLDRLTHHEGVSEEQKVGELARQFEAILLRQILKNIQKTVVQSEFTNDSASREIYQDLLTVNLADGITRAGGFGLANSLQAELARQARAADQEKM